MCGISAILNFNGLPAHCLINASSIVAHRGPDDEGFLLWNPGSTFQRFSSTDTAANSIDRYHLSPLPEKETNWKVGFAHRRLSILDLSPGGHQPMCEGDHFALTYNGEIFNYLEIKSDLEKMGHVFETTSDTEVILKAWKQWGIQCLSRFNGMFAFVLLDKQAQKLYAVRDRFGVKPLYYTTTASYTAFTSEVKQLRVLPDYRFVLNRQIAYDFLRYSMLDHDVETFEEGILQVAPGHYIEIDLQTHQQKSHRWYTLKPVKWKGTDQEAIARFYALLKDSVLLRMRSDVPVGSALSGGLDSSTIVNLMRDVLSEEKLDEHPIQTVTSCSKYKEFDEWEYAEAAIQQVKATSHQIYPTFEKLQKDLDRLLWHMDYPFGSTSQFSQWCVFEEAKRNGLPVMINGQGADEQLAGYGGNDMSLYIGLLNKGHLRELWKETKAYKAYNGKWPVAFITGAVQHLLPNVLMNLLPDRYRVFKQYPSPWLKHSELKKRFHWPNSLNESLKKQVTQYPLPSLLRYEDRNSMAFSVESRVPFMDHRLIEFTLGLPENLVYRRGERKYILRQAFKGIVPDKIIQRKDKMGFVSAEERWLKEEGIKWFEEHISRAEESTANFVNGSEAMTFLKEMQSGARAFDFDPWKIICFSLWLKSMSSINNKG